MKSDLYLPFDHSPSGRYAEGRNAKGKIPKGDEGEQEYCIKSLRLSRKAIHHKGH